MHAGPATWTDPAQRRTDPAQRRLLLRTIRATGVSLSGGFDKWCFQPRQTHTRDATAALAEAIAVEDRRARY